MKRTLTNQTRLPGARLSPAPLGACTTLAAALALSTAAPAYATDAPPPQSFDAGQACSFALRIDSSAANSRLDKTFKDENGNTVKVLMVGKGPFTTLTNLSTGKTLTLAGNGVGSVETTNPDGTFTDRTFGHTILILFPTDVPSGPTTTLVTGSIVYTRDAFFNFTVLKISGTTRDLCAELA